MRVPKKLEQKLIQRQQNNALRRLSIPTTTVDFSSNDYLGFASSEVIFTQTHQLLLDNNCTINGATGSRLLTGNFNLYNETERYIAHYHQVESALVFNSGYDANLGFFSAVPQRGDIIMYDELIHASIRDGIQLSNAKAYKFNHNSLLHLEERLRSVQAQAATQNADIYIVTESVFSMDGDSPDLKAMAELCQKYKGFFVVDEAHALGVLGDQGRGQVNALQLNDLVFAQIITFGKALGCHGAAILGGKRLTEYIINFARSFIYTTGLSPHSVATILIAYQQLAHSNRKQLQENIQHFKAELQRLKLSPLFIDSDSAIHCCVISGNDTTRDIAYQLQLQGFAIKPILSPTVPKGKERLRFCLHSYNSREEITTILELLATFVV